MNLKITYTPDIGVVISGTELNWGSQREIVRKKLNNSHEAKDIVNNIAGFSQKRDIYKNYDDSNSLFFLNYNKDNLLIELEVHDGAEIIVGTAVLSFEKELSLIINDLLLISPLLTKTGDGEYFFEDLKLTVSDLEAMGSAGGVLGYFYCAANTEHLTQDTR